MALKPYLLSIAIPTWNRALTLDLSLKYLLVNTNPFKEYIEIIISDNASNDDTNEVIIKHINNNPSQTIIHNRNQMNIGFYGNFKKCRDISSGKYLWVLGDDDFVQDNVIEKLIKQLTYNNDLAFAYLKNKNDTYNFSIKITSTSNILQKEGHNLGLISSVIFNNNKNNDDLLYSEYSESPFIGFIFLLNSFQFGSKVSKIEGNCLSIANDKPKGYDFFKVFVSSMDDVTNYMKSSQIPDFVINKFVERYFTDFILKYYILYRAEKKMNFGHFELEDINLVNSYLFASYSKYFKFWTFFYPFIILPAPILRMILYFKRKKWYIL